MWKEQAVEKATGFLYGIKKKACCIMCRQNSVEPVLLATCYRISSIPHEVLTVKKKEGKIKTYWKIVVNGQMPKADINLLLFYCKSI